MSYPQTPGHALPGAFLNTPAVASRFNAQTQQDPVRRRLFSQNSASAPSGNAGQVGVVAPNMSTVAENEALLQASQGTPAPPQPPLAKAATYVNNALTKDENYPELDSYCRREFPLGIWSPR